MCWCLFDGEVNDKAREFIEIRKNNNVKLIEKQEKDMKKFRQLFFAVSEEGNTKIHLNSYKCGRIEVFARRIEY